MGWIGVDLDGTLAHWETGGDINQIGAPIGPMVERVKGWLAKGKDVRIMTARVAPDGRNDPDFVMRQVNMIHAWCAEHLGQTLRLTYSKDFSMIELWDDRCVQVIPNTGIPIGDQRRVK